MRGQVLGVQSIEGRGRMQMQELDSGLQHAMLGVETAITLSGVTLSLGGHVACLLAGPRWNTHVEIARESVGSCRGRIVFRVLLGRHRRWFWSRALW